MAKASKELVVFEREKKSESDIHVRRHRSNLRVAQRDEYALGFIEGEEGGFIGIKTDLSIKIRNDEIRSINLVTDDSKDAQELFARLNASANQYFEFPNDFFEFHRSEERTFRDLLRRPLTHADLEEQKAEEQFPDDIEPRALMKALIDVIERNQWTHILQKRIMQLVFTFFAFVLILLWAMLSPMIVQLVHSILSTLPGAAQAAVAIATMLLTLYIVLTYGLMSLLLKKLLMDYTIIFRQINRASCRQVITKMNTVNNWLNQTFFKLVADVEDTQDDFDVIRRSDWAETATGVFRIALWFGKRIESLERFGQVQFERLRIFEMISERIGNVSSLVLWLVCAGLSLFPLYLSSGSGTVGLLQFIIAFGGFAIVAWKFGATTRRARYSFGMEEIAKEQFNDNWRNFSELGYYGKIAALYKAAKDAVRTEVISKHPGAAVRG